MDSKEPRPPDTYETDELNLAAFLITTGVCSLVKIKAPDGSRRRTFVLTPVPTEEQRAAFYAGATCSAVAYDSNVRNLHQALRQVGPQGGK